MTQTEKPTTTIFDILTLRAKKGTYGYIHTMKRFAAIRAALCCGFSLLLVICGRLIFTRYAGLFTLLAIISSVPAAMSAVSFIMYARFRTGSREIFDSVESLRNNAPVFYDSVITTPDKSYGVNCFVALNKNLLAFSDHEKVEVSKLEKYLQNMARKNGYKDWTIKVFTDFSAYQERLGYLKEKKVKPLNKDREMIELVGNLSL